MFSSVVVLFGNLYGFRRYDPGMLLVGSCSAAISAACYRPAEDRDASIRPVMLGTLVEGEEGGVGPNKVRHYRLTIFKVEPPVEGRLYTGSIYAPQITKPFLSLIELR